jgi:eukaryotic sulfide quinone oxidoreductase
MENRTPLAKYDGYASCPVVTGKNKLLLLEFTYGGVPKESFTRPPWSLFFNQRTENYPMYLLKAKFFPFIYWHMLKGRWFGPSAFSSPTFPFHENN